MLITSALNRVAASSNEVRVRVLGSTKKFTNVLPRRAGTFFTSRVPTCLNASAVSSTNMISSAESSRKPSKSFRVQRVLIGSFPQQPHAFFCALVAEPHPHFLIRRGGKIFADVVGSNGKLPVSAVDQYGQLNPGRAAKRADRIHRSAHSAAGVKNVIDDHN